MWIINVFGSTLIVLIVWWFWLYKPTSVKVTKQHRGEQFTVVVDNGTYQPSRITVVSGRPTTITFMRKSDSPCSATLLFPDFEISEELPLNKEKKIMLPALEVGEYAFHCQMKMYKGVLSVESST